MSLSRKIAKNAAIQYTSKIIGTILGLFTIALLTRYLGAAGFGEYTVAASYLQFTGTLVDFGFTITAVRMLAEAGADRKKIFGNIVTLRLISALFVFAASAAQFATRLVGHTTRCGVGACSAEVACLSDWKSARTSRTRW